MKKVLLVAVAICAVCAAAVSCQGGKNPKSYTAIDSLSYAAGVQFGTNFRMQDSTLNGAIFGAALADAFAKKNWMTIEDANNFIQEWFMVRKPAMAKAESEAWFNELKTSNPNIQTTESGLMYEILNAGDPAVKAVNDADQVVAKYRGTLSDGTEFDRNDSIAFPLNGVIRGWTEGMKLIGKGGDIVLWIPAELGYGAQGGGPIPPNSALKFEVKLLDVIPAAE